MAEEERQYDSTDWYEMVGARLTKDPEIRDGANGKMVRLSFASTCRRKGTKTLWVEANVCDFNADAASYLKQKDVLWKAEGKPFIRFYGENDSQFAFGIDRAELTMSPELKKALKERGWVPKQGNAAPNQGTKQPPKRTTKRSQPREQIELPED